VGDCPAGVWDAPLGREGGDPYDLDQHGGGNGFGGELHVRSLPAGPAAGYGMLREAIRRAKAQSLRAD
jgi:hypothetical protein